MRKLVLCSAASLAIGIGIGFSLGNRGEPQPPTREQMLTYIEGLSAKELGELKGALQERWGVRAGATPLSR